MFKLLPVMLTNNCKKHIAESKTSSCRLCLPQHAIQTRCPKSHVYKEDNNQLVLFPLISSVHPSFIKHPAAWSPWDCDWGTCWCVAKLQVWSKIFDHLGVSQHVAPSNGKTICIYRKPFGVERNDLGISQFLFSCYLIPLWLLVMMEVSSRFQQKSLLFFYL